MGRPVAGAVPGHQAGRGYRIDALVTAAGWGLAGAAEQCSVAEAKAQLETNFWGTVRVVQQALPAMRAGGGGRKLRPIRARRPGSVGHRVILAGLLGSAWR